MGTKKIYSSIFFLLIILSGCAGGSGNSADGTSNSLGTSEAVKKFVETAKSYTRPIEAEVRRTFTNASISERQKVCDLETKVGKDTYKTAKEEDVKPYDSFTIYQKTYFKAISSLIQGPAVIFLGQTILGRPSLYFAAENDGPCLLKKLADAGANLNEIYMGGSAINRWTALHIAAKYGKISVIKELAYRQGINLEVQAAGRQNKTPLHIAAESDKLEIVKELVKAGANKNAIDTNNRTPQQLATMRGYNNIATWLANN